MSMFIKLTTKKFVEQKTENGIERVLTEKVERINTAQIVLYHDLSSEEIEQINRKGDLQVRSRVSFLNNSLWVKETASEIDLLMRGLALWALDE